MDLRQLRYFLAIADERHFGRAADQLGMTQPPLSARIQGLERELGVRLFHRGPGEPVGLTFAGEFLLPQARDIVAAADRAKRTPQLVGRGQIESLEMAAAPGGPGAMLVEAIRVFGTSWPQVRVSVTEMESRVQLAELGHGRLDVALVRHIGQVGDVVVRPVLRTELGVVIDREHPLADADTIRLSDLKGAALLLARADADLIEADELVEECRSLDLQPASVHVATHPEEFRGMLAATLQQDVIAVTARQANGSLPPTVAWRALTDSPLTITTSAVTSSTAPQIAAQRLASAIVDAAARAIAMRYRPGPIGLGRLAGSLS